MGSKKCTETQRTLCNDENCQTCFNKSFASHPKAKYWSDKNGVSARKIIKGSKKNAYLIANVATNLMYNYQI